MTMAENLDDGEFWLPPQFLSDTDADAEAVALGDDHRYSKNNNVVVSDEAKLFRSEFPYCVVTSNMSSPLGGSSETTESDGEEQHQLAELTRLMARSSLEADFHNALKSTGQLMVSAGSPQSTLCAFGNGCSCLKGKGSGQGSPNKSVCQLSSGRATWDLLHAAAGEVERMRLNQEQTYAFNNPYLGYPDVGFFPQQQLIHQQLQFAQFEMLRQQQLAKHQQNIASASAVAAAGAWGVYEQRPMLVPNAGRKINNGPLGLAASAWPSLQHANGKMQQPKNQQPLQYGGAAGSGMRAVFLGDGRRECAGTGVFLPRTAAAAASKKKPACSTALVPDRVVQAINRKKMENMVGGQHRFNASSNMENAAVPKLKSNYAHSQQKRNIKPQPTAVNNEIKLPQEWTY